MTLSGKVARVATTLLIFIILIIALGCSTAGGPVRLLGKGASFPNLLYQKWISDYGKTHPDLRIDYQAQGSDAGVKAIQEQQVDFGASDAAMSDADMKGAPGEIIHIPTVIGAVVFTYNLEGISQPLRFSPDVLADIFLGKIKKWNDPRIKADNEGINLSESDIILVYRSGGTTEVLIDYLSKVSPELKGKVKEGRLPDWPEGSIDTGSKGNDGVTARIKQTPNTLGYIELAYAVQNKLPVALIKNKAGQFVEPSLDKVTAAAAESLASTPEDLRVSITDASGAGTYPISSYTYILVYKDQKDATKGKALVDFLWWGVHDGEQYAKDLQYAPLPAEIVKRVEAKLNAITSGGRPLRSGQ